MVTQMYAHSLSQANTATFPHYISPTIPRSSARTFPVYLHLCRNLSLLQQAGAELVFFSPLADPLPPAVSGLYLGGGYPERFAVELSYNHGLRAAVKAFARAGGVVYGECGGLMYLAESIQTKGESAVPMGKGGAHCSLNTCQDCKRGCCTPLSWCQSAQEHPSAFPDTVPQPPPPNPTF
jgi:cobyrinic acid a,c-diamide synthase